MSNLQTELDFFDRFEPQFIKEGHFGQYVAITGHQILAFARNRDELMKGLVAKFANRRPESLLIRQVLGEQRRPLLMRSPRVVRTLRICHKISC